MNAEDGALFRFAIVSDTHIRPKESDQSSPWIVNTYANGRARRLVSLLRAQAPEFVIHLGDMVHPLPSLPSYGDAVAEAKRILSPLEAPMYLIPGNHDVGDKPMPGMPAAPATAEDVAKYREAFGPDWQVFEHGGCRFVLLDAAVINTGLEAEAEQRAFAEATLSAPFDGRTLVFIHYPPFILAPDEPSNYDNLDEPGRSWLVDLLKRTGVSAVFSGHVHNFFYNRLEGMELYVLPALSFVRQDYSELFRGGPGPEFGRDDADKLGFVVVDVYPDRIVPRLVRTFGDQDEEGAPVPALPPLPATPTPSAPLGLHLRDDWREVVTMPYQGSMDEFLRKEARNDYHLLALMELGTRHLRIPLRDLTLPSFRDRAADFAHLGFTFTVFHFGLPGAAELAAVEANAALIETFEVVIPWAERDAFATAAPGWRLPVPVSLTRVASSADRKAAGSTFHHYVSYGFAPEAWDEVASFARGLGGAVASLAFTLGWEVALAETVPDLAAKAEALGLSLVANVRLQSENPAEAADDQAAIAARVAEAMVVAHAVPSAQLFLDTFIDHDRGYFPRGGLYDRRLNPNPAAKVYRHLDATLAGHAVALDAPAIAKGLAFTLDGRPASLATAPCTAAATGRVIDLVTGLTPERATSAGPLLVLP
ncbi:metallophosphoesterase family protein [Acuticoccus sediminis]|uniref:metallophosphoesterase family protein n=1 Tax=Acuticoccus sediminis TaxID=2184697 RepID=UPI001CFD0CAE|nr:metallophosphoesterase [Acuticoccus sediminis]